MDQLRLFTADEWQALGGALRLSERQLRIAQLICAEYTLAQIARRLNRSRDTIATHVRLLYKRLRARSRVGVVVRLVECHRNLQASGDIPLPRREGAGGGSSVASSSPRRRAKSPKQVN